MKRKVYAFLLSAVFTVALVAVPVIASSSPTTSPAPASAVSITVAGSSVEVLTSEIKTEVSSVVSNTAVLINLGVSTDAKIASSFDLKYSGTIPTGGVQIPIAISAGNVGDYAYILHRTESGQWEKVGEGVLGADRTVVGTFTSFSPVAVMIVDAASAVSTVTAPKTGN